MSYGIKKLYVCIEDTINRISSLLMLRYILTLRDVNQSVYRQIKCFIPFKILEEKNSRVGQVGGSLDTI